MKKPLPPPPPSTIFDHFLVVGLKEDNQALTPTILSVFPATSAPTANVALFCFPEDINLDNVNRIRMGASFFFVLTDEVGRQQVGFTRRTGKGKDVRCLCMLTHRDSSWMHAFAIILEECETRHQVPGQLEPFLTALYAAMIPEPGREIVFPSPTLCPRNPIICPDTTDTALFGVSMLPLLATLTTTPILQLFASLLFERRTIVYSSTLDRVSACVQSAVSALFPFAWHHIFIPVLPLPLVDYCSAPMPFVIGLHSSLMLSLQKMPLSEVVFVDLDRDQVSALPADLALLPPALITPLRAALDSATADFHHVTSSSKSNLDWQRVAAAFRHFFVKVFAGYGRFFVKKPHGDGVTFDKNAFLLSQPKPIKKFLEVFITSQMFERFIAEREMGKQNSLFENEVKLYESAQAVAQGNSLQDKAKKSVEKITAMGAKYVENVKHTFTDNPFAPFHSRHTDHSHPPPPSTAPISRAPLHPSLVRPSPSVQTDPHPRRPKPLPPVPPTSSAFPPNIPASTTPASTPWDAFINMRSDEENKTENKPFRRPKAATVTAATPAAFPSSNTTTAPPLVHSSSSSSLIDSIPAALIPADLIMAQNHPSQQKNIFEFNPFENFDPTPPTPASSVSRSMIRGGEYDPTPPTPASSISRSMIRGEYDPTPPTPASSISRSMIRGEYDPTPPTPASSISRSMIRGEYDPTPPTPASSISRSMIRGEFDPTPPTPASSISNSQVRSESNTHHYVNPAASFSLPPVSMKPHNPFADSPDASARPPSPPANDNLFTSFNLDALAPLDGAHTASSSLHKSYPTQPSFPYSNTNSMSHSNPLPHPSSSYTNPSHTPLSPPPPAAQASATLPNNPTPHNPFISPTLPHHAPPPAATSPSKSGEDDFDSFLAARHKN